MDEAFINDFKELLRVTDSYLETFYNYIDTEMLELASITLVSFGNALPDHIEKTEKLPKPKNGMLKRIKESYIDWLKLQLRACQLLNEYEENPDEHKREQWQASFEQAKTLQVKTGQLILDSNLF